MGVSRFSSLEDHSSMILVDFLDKSGKLNDLRKHFRKFKDTLERIIDRLEKTHFARKQREKAFKNEIWSETMMIICKGLTSGKGVSEE